MVSHLLPNNHYGLSHAKTYKLRPFFFTERSQSPLVQLRKYLKKDEGDNPVPLALDRLGKLFVWLEPLPFGDGRQFSKTPALPLLSP